MSENHQNGSKPGVASMVEGILEDGQKLVRQEIALAQHEVAQAWDKGKTAAALLASALVVFNVGGVLLSIMLAMLLYPLLPDHQWACFGIVGGFVALLGGPLIYLGLHRINAVHVSLPQTAEPLREDVQAVTAAASGGRTSPDPLLKR
jgi:hypothetical protein